MGINLVYLFPICSLPEYTILFFTLITLVIAINLILDGIGTNRLTVNETQITLYRLPFFIKRIPLSMVIRLDYVEVQTVFGRNDILRCILNQIDILIYPTTQLIHQLSRWILKKP